MRPAASSPSPPRAPGRPHHGPAVRLVDVSAVLELGRYLFDAEWKGDGARVLSQSGEVGDEWVGEIGVDGWNTAN